MVELKPCPFCGSIAPAVHISRERATPSEKWQYQVICNWNWSGCGASSGFYEEPIQAFDAWNRRVSDD